jgi:hypothetical protein
MLVPHLRPRPSVTPDLPVLLKKSTFPLEELARLWKYIPDSVQHSFVVTARVFECAHSRAMDKNASQNSQNS